MTDIECLAIDSKAKDIGYMLKLLAPFLIRHQKIPYLRSIEGTEEKRLILHPRIQSPDSLPQEVHAFLASRGRKWSIEVIANITTQQYRELFTILFFSKSKLCAPLKTGLPMDWKRVLSNFYPTTIRIGTWSYSSVEHCFQASKAKCSSRPEMADWFAMEKANHGYVSSLASHAKKCGAKKSYSQHGAVLDIQKWESQRLQVMHQAIHSRYQQDELFRKVLLSTQGMSLLHFERTGGRSFWGGILDKKTKEIKGENQLGKIMMKYRDSPLDKSP